MSSSSSFSRGWIIFLQVFGTVSAVVGLSVYIAYFGQISDNILPSNQAQEAKALTAMILAFMFYLTWKSIYAAVVIIRFVATSTDIELSNNRFVISALSLTLGGFVTPFILTSLPNINVQSTINPRWFISRHMGIISLVGGAIAISVFYGAAMSAGSTGGIKLTGAELFDGSTAAGAISISMLVVNILLVVFGAITIALFYSPKSSLTMLTEDNSAYGNALRVIAGMWLVIITVELVLTLVGAVLRLVGVIMDVIEGWSQADSGFMAFLYVLASIFNIAITFLYTFYLVDMTVKTISGIWSQNGIQIPEYEPLAKGQQRNAQTR